MCGSLNQQAVVICPIVSDMVGREPIKCIGSAICCGCTDVYRSRYALLLQVSAILGLGHYLPRRPPPESGIPPLLHLNSCLLCIKAFRVVHNPPSKVSGLPFRRKRTGMLSLFFELSALTLGDAIKSPLTSFPPSLSSLCFLVSDRSHMTSWLTSHPVVEYRLSLEIPHCL
jgi:hypothetical protein